MADLQKLLSRMTLEEKIGQMTQVTFSTFTSIPEPDLTGIDPGDATQKVIKHHLGTIDTQSAIRAQTEHLARDVNRIPPVAHA